MPPEQLPWDRRDFRKHERSASDPRFGGGGYGGGGPHRWREQQYHTHAPPLAAGHQPPYHHQPNHQQQQRWYSDFRSTRPISSGHGKQGGWHMYPDDAVQGFLPFGSRYVDRNLEDDNFRPFGSRGDGRYFRNSRENRGSVSQKDWRSPSWEPAALSSGPGRPTYEVNNQKSVENTEICHNNSKINDSSHPLRDSFPDQSPSLAKEKQEKNGGTADGPESSSQKSEKENGLESIDWKPLKWTRSGSLSSRGSGFSHSSGSKSVGVDFIEMASEVPLKNFMPVQSPTLNAMSTAAASLDETSSRKKPRLGWGEGLAKYEKKKIEGPEDGVSKDGLVINVTNTDSVQSPSLNLSDKSPRVLSLSDCVSPATPSSVGCSSSPGIEEKESFRAANADQDRANLSCWPEIATQTYYEGPTFNLENFDITSIAKLSSLINELLPSEDPSSGETDYARTTSVNKLAVWKADVLKAIELTESKIDSLESELKSLMADPRSCCLFLAAPNLLPGECQEQVTASGSTAEPDSLQGVSSGNVSIENMPAVMEEESGALNDEEIDSPGSATQEIVEISSGEDACPSGKAKCVEGLVNLDTNNSISLNQPCYKNGLCNEADTSRVDVRKPNLGSCHNDSVGGMQCDVDHITIWASNKDSASSALEELNRLLPSRRRVLDISIASSVSSSQSDSSVIKDKFLLRKQSLKFKEKVILLKFKIFQHFWKEGRVVSVRKLRGKSHKMLDLTHSGYKKIRSSSRSRISYFAGGHRTVPAEEVIKFVNELCSESSFKPCRNTLKMPALILDKEIKTSRFISNNGLVEDPCAAESERSMINPWSDEEREIFIDKLAIFGKNFGKIAPFLEHKTIADCVEFYYKNHKSESFEKARKKPDFAKQKKSQSATYLVGTGKRRNPEANSANLDMLGEASIIAANANDGIETQQRCTPRILFSATSSHRVPRVDYGLLQRSKSLDMYSKETVAADVLAGICGSLSSEAMSSCITSSFDHADGYQDWKCPRFFSGTKRPLTPDVTQDINDECSDESCGEMDLTDWTDDEKSIFIQAVSSYGKDFAMISRLVRTRSKEQCKIFFSKARKCLGLDQIHSGAGNAVSADANGGGSDIEDGCVVQAGSIICNSVSKCKMEEDLPPPDLKVSQLPDMAGTHNFNPDVKMCGETSGPCLLDSMATEPVLKNSSIGDTQVEKKPFIDCRAACKEQGGACGAESEARTLVVSSHTESVPVEEGDNCGTNGSSKVDNNDLPHSGGPHWRENEGKGLMLHENKLDAKKFGDRHDNSSGFTAINCAATETKFYPQLARNLLNASVDTSPPMQVESGSQKMADPESFSAEKSCVISFRQSGHFTTMESSTLVSVPVKYQRHSSNIAVANVGVNGITGKHSQEYIRTGDCRQHLSGYSLLNPVDSAQILRGYPTSGQSAKEIDEDVTCKNHAFLNSPKQDGNSHSDRNAAFSLQKCTTSRHQGEVFQAPFPSQEQSARDGSRPSSGCSSDSDKPSRNGDVKLFGKILISSQQIPNSYVQETGDDNAKNHKASCQSLNLRSSSDQKVNFESSVSKFDCNKFLGSENIPVRSYGFQDGNTATGFAPLPDSTLLLTKYPAAFSNHSASTVKLEQPTVHGVVGSNDQPLTGISVFPSRELSSRNGVSDYQVLRNCELQSFTMDVKQPQERLFSEMQRRNGFDAVRGIQHQARGMLGINVAGRAGVVVGGPCSDVSDPVTAIKMQYAKAQNFSVQTAKVRREDDIWRSNGDVGR